MTTTDRAAAPDVLQADLAELMTLLGISTHARPQSPHEVFQQEVLPAVRKLCREPDRAAAPDNDLRERFAMLATAVTRTNRDYDRLVDEGWPLIRAYGDQRAREAVSADQRWLTMGDR